MSTTPQISTMVQKVDWLIKHPKLWARYDPELNWSEIERDLLVKMKKAKLIPDHFSLLDTEFKHWIRKAKTLMGKPQRQESWRKIGKPKGKK